jgi:hypothetical protein
MSVAQPRFKAIYADTVAGREPRVLRVRVLAITAGMLMCIGAIVILAIGVVTAFQARRLYAACATALSRMILWLYGIDLEIHGAPPWPCGQNVYVSNHTSTLDVFVLVALGLPTTRFFLSGFLRQHDDGNVLYRAAEPARRAAQDLRARRAGAAAHG